jgi:rare lipoprotein A (peptidoglycan hydrolase)
MRISIAVIVMAVLAVPAADAKTKHLKGCNTYRCDKRVGKKWAGRHPMMGALASWYSPADSGGTPACGLGWPATGVANKTLPCGARIRMCHSGNCITAVIADRGPYVAGREFDLMPSTKAALGCGDLCYVKWRMTR